MPTPQIMSAAGCSLGALREAMRDAFSDYAIPMQLSPQHFAEMMQQRGLDLQSARIANVDGQIASIWLTAVRGDRAYLISSGTRPAYRSLGLARALATDSLEYMRQNRVASFQTEVLCNNDVAAALYTSLGMVRQRQLDCYRLDASDPPKAPDIRFQEYVWSQIAQQAPALCDWEPSWQNDGQSLDASCDQLLCLARFEGADLIAFAAIHRRTGTVQQIAVRTADRRKGIATALIADLQHHLLGVPLRFINICSTDAGFNAWIEGLGATQTIGQFELKMSL